RHRVEVAHAVVDNGDSIHDKGRIGWLQDALGGRDGAVGTRVDFGGGAKGATESLEDGLTLVVSVLALEVVDVQRGQRVVYEALEKFACQVYVESTYHRAGEGHVVEQAGAAREVDDDAGKGFVQGHIGMSVTAQAGFVAHGGGKGLTQRNAHVFDCVVV